MKNIFWRTLFDQFDQIDGVQSDQDVIEVKIHAAHNMLPTVTDTCKDIGIRIIH